MEEHTAKLEPFSAANEISKGSIPSSAEAFLEKVESSTQLVDSAEENCKEVQDIEILQKNALKKVHGIGSKKDGQPELFVTSLLAMESLDDDDTDTEETQYKPAKLPCKRNAISPTSREKLLLASRFVRYSETFASLRKPKTMTGQCKGSIGVSTFSHGVSESGRDSVTLDNSISQSGKAASGSPCHNKDFSDTGPKSPPSKLLLSKLISSSPSGKINHPPSEDAQRVPCDDMSPPVAANGNSSVINVIPATSSSPTSLPTKGILRTASRTCQSACKCEECLSVRSRAERASEFSLRQMHDIEGLTVKLLKELSSLRTIVEEKVAGGATLQSLHSVSSLEKARRAASNALNTEVTAKKWLIRMARDCNRYCKIMRMQQRRLSFADDSGGQLCQVKVFKSETGPGLSNCPVNCIEDATS